MERTGFEVGRGGWMGLYPGSIITYMYSDMTCVEC